MVASGDNPLFIKNLTLHFISGIPVRNGTTFVREIAQMSLELLEAFKTFEIRHLQKEHLKLRIGINTGIGKFSLI